MLTVLNPYAPDDVADGDVRILIWDEHWFGPEYELPLVTTTPAAATIRVSFTRDRGETHTADAIWIHPPTVRELPTRREGQPWILASMEANTHYPLQLERTARAMFDITMTYQPTSDVPTPYANRRQYGGFEQRPRPPQAPEPVCFIASNPVAHRDEYVAELGEHLPVASYGQCLRNAEFADVAPLGTDRGEQAMLAIASHPFYLAFENCRESDYVTEKLYRPLSVGTIPVYWGAPNAAEYLPNATAAVPIGDDMPPVVLAERLLAILDDPGLLAEHRSWVGSERPKWSQLLDLGDVDPRARLATKLVHGCDRNCRCGGSQRGLW